MLGSCVCIRMFINPDSNTIRHRCKRIAEPCISILVRDQTRIVKTEDLTRTEVVVLCGLTILSDVVHELRCRCADDQARFKDLTAAAWIDEADTLHVRRVVIVSNTTVVGHCHCHLIDVVCLICRVDDNSEQLNIGVRPISYSQPERGNESGCNTGPNLNPIRC